VLFRGNVGADDAGQGVAIGYRQRTQSQRGGGLHQFIRMRGAAEEAEVAHRLQLGVCAL